KGLARGSQIIDGYGDDNSLDRLQGWYDNLPTDARAKIDDEFIADIWRILDSAGNLLIRKHKDYGPKNIAHSPGGALNGLRVRMHDKVARINHLIDSRVAPSNESLRDSFIDLLNYSAIAIMVLDKKWPELPND
ncbi:MAG: nucleotide modification associated domain-containing protein, partial [Candidatus Nanopelagicaceae bacterium]